jgi:hypothetical protein
LLPRSAKYMHSALIATPAMNCNLLFKDLLILVNESS